MLGDPIPTEQVILNLLGNALDAIAEKQGSGRIDIDARADGPWIDLTVRDDGIGLGDLTPEQAINPFVTSKEAGRGMGLGPADFLQYRKGLRVAIRRCRRARWWRVARLRPPAADRQDRHDERPENLCRRR